MAKDKKKPYRATLWLEYMWTGGWWVHVHEPVFFHSALTCEPTWFSDAPESVAPGVGVCRQAVDDLVSGADLSDAQPGDLYEVRDGEVVAVWRGDDG